MSRPRIFVELNGPKNTIQVPALIDSGCDVTVIPKGVAEAIGLSMGGKKDELFAFRESTDVIQSSLNMTFLGKADRLSMSVQNIPVLIALTPGYEESELEITLGINGIFDIFEITFKKHQNKIIFKPISQNYLYKLE